MADKQRARVSRQEWAKRVQRWNESGLGAREFAAHLNINPGTLRQWKYQFDGEKRGTRRIKGEQTRKPSAKAPQTFVELTAPVAASSDIELRVGVYQLRVPHGFDEASLLRLLALLERRL